MADPIAYSYVKTLCVDSTAFGRWYEADTSTYPLYQQYQIYRKFYLILTETDNGKQVALDMDKVRNQCYGFSGSIVDFLTQNSNKALPTEDVPVLNPKYVKYGDAYRQRYQAYLTAPGVPVGNTVAEDTMTELVLTRDSTSYNGFDDYCLVSINGYLHHTDYDSKGIYVQDAGLSLRHCNMNQIGIYSFLDVGKIEKVPLAGKALTPVNTGAALADGFVMDVGPVPSGCYIMFSIGGYLVPITGRFLKQIDDQIWNFNMHYFNWEDRYLEMDKVLDLSSFNLKKDAHDTELVETKDLYSDDTIRKLFGMSQSFMIIVHTNNFFFDKVSVGASKVVGNYRTYNYEGLPMMIGHGRLAEYWPVANKSDFKDTMIGLFVADSLVHQRLHDTGSPDTRIVVEDKRTPTYRTMMSDAYFIRMGKDM